MKISIIIPTLNEAAHIGRLVPYMRESGRDRVAEIIVVDGGSRDGTVEKARAAGANVLEVAVASRATQMNTGAAHAVGEVLYFVHADTWPPDTFATDIIEALEAGHAMGCYRYRFNSPSLLLRFNAWFVRFPWLWCQGGDKTFFIRKAVFWEFNGYDERYVVMEEYDFLRRAKKQYRLRILPKNVIISARKYEHNSWLKVQIANATAFGMFRRGEEPTRIREVYKRMLYRNPGG